MDRRDFLKTCAAGTLAGTPAYGSAADAKPRFYSRAKLVHPGGRPVKSRALPRDVNFIFHYPYAGTPCFLLNLAEPTKPGANLRTADAHSYDWHGGVGANHAVVAYSAICAHRMSYPTRDISFISYRKEASPGSRHARVIHCCSEHSQYDPAEGAKVLAGPAPQPLAAILLHYDNRADELYAIGTLGGEMFREFFSKFEFRLGLEYHGKAKQPVERTCVVSELARFCKQQVKC
ncbi:MAG: hypothetical protein A3H27_09275, partial [Acidobacteria bacterium RIFCSPLOWO2_02_FULL_59_13]